MNEDGIKRLQFATREKLRRFNCMRGKELQPGGFWDVVVVTAVDESQKDAYETQIAEKIDRKELPLGIHYNVFSDPPGAKIGNGGSTLYALQCLDDIYGKTLGRFKVILIHAGGFSQRLPNASALGKIFTALPIGEPLYQMLELKLAMYVDFPSQMKPGILVTCADDIEIYSIAEDESVRFDKPGFTALAHPSLLSVGTTHGVFVLEQHEKTEPSEMEYISCLHFLHKPSISKMRDSGAVCQMRGVGSSLTNTEFVYTDSTYYLDYDTAIALCGLLKEVGPLECEIDAYGDFLQALGPKATIAYTCDTANVTQQQSSLVEIRKKIFHRLRGTPLNVLVLNNSKFYHVGTTDEYLYHLTKDTTLRTELGLLSSAFSDCPDEASDGSIVSCVMYSILDPSCAVAPGSVVEYCRLEAGVTVGKRSILSGCWVNVGHSVPEGVFMHSLCVNIQAQTAFVTIVFGVVDNLKRGVEGPAYIEGLELFGVSLEECLTHWGLGNEMLRFSGGMSICSLWNACLFPVCSDRQRSFSMSLDMVQAVLNGSTLALPKDTKLMSMHEALQCKNLEEMLKFRRGLHSDLTQRRRSSS
ncbi:fucose-1-phosphate guanylyltransferase [Lampris incognitus]|uniref:fucose-1-phosphate guanylyltransferase n=1 Tax=Lampris incognitus TaxID=2546036 RepID=UPI0024B585D1|nr:fucose-1-phosphate guanylyltransferase [Lampris incognitus]XP_056132208.1 fucose-1-phosphate guanylyltransferase [Lampris incognitus]